ncbi:MAG: hypothetical protein IT427_20380 [Pirellulales bacterium]|nr:hypothetical protein [Pirellulales bacterium]
MRALHQNMILLGAFIVSAASDQILRLVVAEDSQAFTDPAAAGNNFGLQGEYTGGSTNSDGTPQKLGVQAIALGDRKYQVVRYTGRLPGAGWD